MPTTIPRPKQTRDVAAHPKEVKRLNQVASAALALTLSGEAERHPTFKQNRIWTGPNYYIENRTDSTHTDLRVISNVGDKHVTWFDVTIRGGKIELIRAYVPYPEEQPSWANFILAKMQELQMERNKASVLPLSRRAETPVQP